MADTMSGSDAAGSTSDSWSTRLRRRWSWRRAVESISMPDMSATRSARCTSIGDTSATTRPWRRTTIRSARPKTCSRSWVTSSMPAPCVAAARRISSWTRTRLGHAQRRRRLVEQQQPRARPAAPGQGDELALPPREHPDRPVERQVVAPRPGAGPRRPRVASPSSDEQPTGSRPRYDVGGHVEVVAQPVVLPDDLDAGRRGPGRAWPAGACRRTGSGPRRPRRCGRGRRRATTCRRRSRRPARRPRRRRCAGRRPAARSPRRSAW